MVEGGINVGTKSKLKLAHQKPRNFFNLKNINKLLEIFYLSTSVKVQFFKTFILPYFDYCLTLLIYFNKATIQQLCNKYYLCLHKLFKLDTQEYSDYIELNTFLLEKYDIPAFQHRLFQRVSVFCFKMLNFKYSPKTLKDEICGNFLENFLII